MQQTCIATSPFMENNIQLFYEATLHRDNHSVVLKIFNHRGVLKNKRVLEFPTGVFDIFSAEEYLIILDENHEKVWVMDVRRSRNNIAKGVIGEKNGLSKQMKAKKLKFNSFIYDKISNLIYSVYDRHYVFYFRINYFLDDSLNQSFFSNEQSIAQANRSISINKIIQSTQSINKLQIKNEKLRKKSASSPTKMRRTQQKSLLKCIQQEQQQQKHNKSEYQDEYEYKTLICLLIKQKSLLRKIQIDWNKDKVVSTRQHPQVHDFCFVNGWDLTISLTKKTNNKQQTQKRSNQQTKYKINTQRYGSFEKQTTLSTEYVIFTSEHNLFIIDPLEQIIIGVYNKQWYDVSSCESIPNSINTKNTLVMVDRPDEFYLRFLFEVFDTKFSRFTNKKILTPFVEVRQGAQLQIYLKKNLQKIYTPNAFIHQYFLQRVQQFLSNVLQKQRSPNSSSSSNEYINRSEQMGMREVNFENASEVGRMFLQKFIMSAEHSKSIFDRWMFSLINNSGIKGLFGNKNRLSEQRQKQSRIRKASGSNLVTKRSSLQLVQKTNKQQQVDDNIHRCQFDRWNTYFEQILSDQLMILSKLFEESGELRDDSSGSEYSSSVQNKFSKLYENLSTIKHKLSLLSKAYNRILNFMQTSSLATFRPMNRDNIQQQFISVLKHYKEKIHQNINKVQSLYLIYDIFSLGKGEKRGQNCDQYLATIQTAVSKVFKEIQFKRKQNIFMYKKELLNVGNRPLRIDKQNGQLTLTSGYLMLQQHFSNLMLQQHFSNSRMLAIPSESMTFQLFLQYLLLNVGQFEQTAYFYHLIRTEIVDKNNQKEKGDKNKNKDNNNNNSKDSDKQQREYPFVNRNIVNFFYLIESIPISCNNNNDNNNQQLILFRQRIEKASRLALLIKCPSFINYTIQLCASYSLPSSLIRLIETVQISPFVNDNQLQNNNNELSQMFLYRQQLIMRSLLYCGFNNKSFQFSSTLRDILIYEMKRLTRINDTLLQHQNKLNYNNSRLSKTLSLPVNQQQLQTIEVNQKQQLSEFTTLSHTLLEEFITIVLRNSQCQGVRHLQQLKNQCLPSEEDRKFFQSTVDKVIKEWKQKGQRINRGYNDTKENMLEVKTN